jgi:aminopeptidase
MNNPDRLDQLAELIVRFGANVQPGQIVALSVQPGQETLARAVAESAYRAGAKFVDLAMFDPYLKRARVLHADPKTLGYVPPWLGERLLAIGEHRCARIALAGVVAPHLMDDLDPDLVGRDMLPRLREGGKLLNDRSTNWTISPCPTAEWAELVYPDIDRDAALERLWEAIVRVCRLDTEDPIVAWTTRLGQLSDVVRRLDTLHLEAVRFEGPGTDLTVGLLPTSHWQAAKMSTVDGVVHAPNLPTEEVFTTPDPQRTEGVVTSTKPLLVSGAILTGLSVRFDRGRAVEIEADKGSGTLRRLVERDEGAPRLGEVALVDRHGRVGPLDTVFYETLLDENAASHVALGQGFSFLVDEADRDRVNASEIHIDFMIGSNDVTVTGVCADGREVPLLRGGDWQI